MHPLYVGYNSGNLRSNCSGCEGFIHIFRQELCPSWGHAGLDLTIPVCICQNNFHFEQRDWFTVQPGELTSGDRLVSAGLVVRYSKL